MSGSTANLNKKLSLSKKSKSTNASPEGKGVNLSEIYKGRKQFDFQELPPIKPSTAHTVFFDLSLLKNEPPPPRSVLPQHADKWGEGFVKMPHSQKNLCPIQREGRKKEFRIRWEVIREALLQNFSSTFQLETAILSYNPEHEKQCQFTALHHFFDQVADQNEVEDFFKNLLPKIIDLALQLPNLIKVPMPLLKSQASASISLSQQQVASLIANAFLCTFPKLPRNYNHFNFNRLFSAMQNNKHHKVNVVMEKFKFIFNYFRRVTTETPKGTITIERKYIPKKDFPKWEEQSQKLPLLHITSKGTIETEGAGLLQVDFADKYIGGLFLGLGCVQEEILFLIYPELISTMLVTQVLDETEALVVSGVERFNRYEGYSASLKWAGDFLDQTPRDQSGRRKSSFVAIDATRFKQPQTQFRMVNVLRELNKAYVGFKSDDSNRDDLPAVATGNWGCGIFKGDPKLKVMLQLMAAGVSGRSVVYFTFGDTKLRDTVADMYEHLVQHNVCIDRLFSLIFEFDNFVSKNNRQDLYSYLYAKIK